MQEIFSRKLNDMLYLTYNAELKICGSVQYQEVFHESIRTLIILCKSFHSKQ